MIEELIKLKRENEELKLKVNILNNNINKIARIVRRYEMDNRFWNDFFRSLMLVLSVLVGGLGLWFILMIFLGGMIP